VNPAPSSDRVNRRAGRANVTGLRSGPNRPAVRPCPPVLHRSIEIP
jgi:hypothetical protein